MSRRFDPNAPIVLGHTPDGKPIWTDPKDLILTGDENLELEHNKKREAVVGVAQKLADAVLENAKNFTHQTVVNMFGECPRSDPAAVVHWMDERGIEFIQDGLTTVVKVRGSVVRQMTAKVDPRFAEEVEKFVRREVEKAA